MELKREDYLEPACPLCMQTQAVPVDLRRCLDRLDADLAARDYEAAKRHLDFWRAEARQGNDLRGLLTLENERMGLFRRLGLEQEALGAVGDALALLPETGLEGTVTAATTFLNAGTVCKQFGQPERAVSLYGQARSIYEARLEPGDARLGGLYNNLALALVDLGRYAEARTLYEKAMAIMGGQPHGALELAITELNLADLANAERGLLEAEAEIEARLDRAEALLNDPDLPRNGYYAFVCEKCAPTLEYYGRFAAAAELRAAADGISAP